MTTMLMLVTKGTYQNFTTMAMLASGAVASDFEVKIFAMEDAVYALKKDVFEQNKSFNSPYDEYNKTMGAALEAGKTQPWWVLLEDLKDLGEIEFTVCALVADLLEIKEDDFMHLVDEVAGVAMFAGEAEEADIFISL